MDFQVLAQGLVSGILIAGIYALFASGITLLFGIMRIVNFGHGELLMLAGYISYWLYLGFKMDPFVSVWISMAVLFVVGMFVQRFLINRVLSAAEENQIVLTLGLGIFLQNAIMLGWSPDPMSIRTPYSSEVLRFLGVSISIPSLGVLVLCLLFISIMFIFLTRTNWGKAIRAVAQSRQGAMLVGINVNRMLLITFGFSAALAAAAGSLLAPITYVFPTMGLSYIVKGFIIVVLGGMGSITGALLGSLIIGVVESLSAIYISTGYKDAFSLLVFLLVLVFRPGGLLGKTRV